MQVHNGITVMYTHKKITEQHSITIILAIYIKVYNCYIRDFQVNTTSELLI